MVSKTIIAVLLALILGVPFLMRPATTTSERASPERTLIIVTPHVPQIQYEFALAFEAWYERNYREKVQVDWRQPGGTGDIIKQLSAQYAARCGEIIDSWKKKDPSKLLQPDLDLSGEFADGTLAFDLMMGGGSFDHSKLKSLNTAAYWFRPFERRGAEKVVVRPRGVLDAPTINLERQIIAYVKLAATDATPILLRIPVGAFVNGQADINAVVAASKPNPGEATAKDFKPGEVICELILGQLERQASVSISVPAGFSQEQLDTWYGTNVLGAGVLYEPDQHWLGTAISGFGIVYNKDVLAALGVSEPTSFEDLINPQLAGWIVFADPRQSGSVATTIDAILSYYGWEKGWRLLREMCANTRYYTNSAPRPPIDVSQGEAAAGLCIDFYGRTQSQYVLAAGQDPAQSRVGYVDPKGATYMDADPVSLLRGGPHPELAKRFIEFVLTEEGQALWQFAARSPARKPPGEVANHNIKSSDGLGPQRNELRRMPVRRVMYEKYYDRLIDKVNPFESASTTKPAGWRETIGVMMGAFAIETSDYQYRAWAALRAARQSPSFSPATLAQMEQLFHAWPTTIMPDGAELPFTPQNVKAIVSAWKDGTFKSACEVRYYNFFKDNYLAVTALAPSPTPTKRN